MNKRYQVFVSSTYEDLLVERQEVMQALLESDCIPAGMELFPAADEDSWSLIKRVIDECDYYVLILAGRYGSVGFDGLGYTEMEYRYALDIGIPILGFLHKDPCELPVSRTDQDEGKQKKLAAFRKLAERKSVRYWTTAPELGALVGRGLLKQIEQTPAIGWIRGNKLPPKSRQKEVEMLNDRISTLEKRLAVENVPIHERPHALDGSTYEIDSPISSQELYVTINDVVIDAGTETEHRRPFEILINSKTNENVLWLNALSRIISMNFQQGVSLEKIVGELQGIYDPRGGYFKPGGKFMPSEIADIGAVIEWHAKRIGLWTEID